MSVSPQIMRCFSAGLPSTSSFRSSSPCCYSSNYQCRGAPLRIICCSNSVASVQEALPTQIKQPSPSPSPKTDEDKRVSSGEGDSNNRSGIKVPRQRCISVSKSDLLDAIISAMFTSQEDAHQFLTVSRCLDLILHAEHKTILEEMRSDFDDLADSGKANTFRRDDFPSIIRNFLANQEQGAFKDNSLENNSSEMEQDDKVGNELFVSSDFALDLKQFLDFSLETAKRSLTKSSRVHIPGRYQHAFMKLLYNAEFEELSVRDLMLASALNTDYLLTLPILVDWNKASESNTIIFRRGYATERQKGLLIAAKFDYLQSKLLQSFFFPLIGKPLGKFFVWLNELFKSITLKLDPEILENKFMLRLKELSLFMKPQSYDQQIPDDLDGVDILSSDLPIWVAAQKASTRYEGILSAAGPRERLLRNFLMWIGLVPSSPKQSIDLDLDNTGSESNSSPSFLSRISLGDIWRPASPNSCGNDLRKMLRTAISILFSPSILQEPAFQELILLYTEEIGERDTTDQVEVPPLQMKIYERIPIPELPVVFPHKKLSFRILDTVRLDGATILGLLAYFFSYKFEDILSSPSAILLDVIAASALVIYVGRVLLGYKITRDRYQLLVNKTLYEKTIASGFGCIHFLLDASEQQQYKEAILVYATLLKADDCQATSTRAIADRCEEFIYNVFQEKIEMPVEKAIKTLMKLGLVTDKAVNGQVVVQAVPCPEAILILINRWNCLIG